MSTALRQAAERLADILETGVAEEPPAELVLRRLVGLVDPDIGVIRLLMDEGDYFPDEAPFITWRAELAASGALSDGGYTATSAIGGRALTRSDAVTGAVFEAYERYCLAIYRRADLVRASHVELVAAGETAVDPVRLAGWRPSSDGERIARETIAWTRAYSVLLDGDIWVPSQLVHLPYRFEPDEPVLREPLTTGTAAGLTRGAAIQRGLFEVVERDAAMLLHYLRLPTTELGPEALADPELTGMLDELAACRLPVRLLQVDNGIGAATVVARIDDPSGIGPAQTLGSKCAPDPTAAAKGALLEAATMRRTLRIRRERARADAEPYLADLSRIDCVDTRSCVWAQPELSEALDYLVPQRKPAENARHWRGTAGFVEDVLGAGGDILIADVTTPDVASLGISVVKVIVPDLQPMHLSEQYRSWTDRLLSFGCPPGIRRTPADLNPVPHPFL
jgi:ribosomal protein S12 methylthiotransferase accessory factor